MTSYPNSGSESAGLPGLPVCLPSSQSIKEYIARVWSLCDVRRFVAMPNYTGHLFILHILHPRGTADGARHKQWKHWGVQGASELRTASAEIDPLLVRCAAEVEYQRGLRSLLVTWQHGDVATWRRGKLVRALLKVSFCCLGSNWSVLWIDVKRRYG